MDDDDDVVNVNALNKIAQEQDAKKEAEKNAATTKAADDASTDKKDNN